LKKAIVIGSGFSGLSAASFLARESWSVTVVEKHDIAGGRARQLKEKGFTFDMGPSWYWMPDVYDNYFACFGKKRSDYYALTRLDPSYTIVWEDEKIDIPAEYGKLKYLFDRLEPGSGKKLDAYLEQASFKYKTGINKLVHKPGRSWTEFLDLDIIRGMMKLEIFSSIQNHIKKNFTNKKIRQMLEFPVLFLGALPKDTPALYSLMNFADIKGGTWYPEDGMYGIVNAMLGLAKELGVNFEFKEEAIQIKTLNNVATGLTTIKSENGQTIKKEYDADVIIASADYHFVETNLLPKELMSYSDSYWEKRVLAPAALVYYVGIRKKIRNIAHHTLFFDVDFERHGREIYEEHKWPTNPLFYTCATTVTDKNAAPEGCENLFFLIPVAAGLEGDSEELRLHYFDNIIKRFESYAGEAIEKDIIYLKTYGPSDFKKDYNAFKGNAYGLANTLKQTAVLKPACQSKKVKNLFYTGQMTVPGPGVPPSLISGEVVAKQILKYFRA
jgi:phytoene desaturase